MIKNELSIYKFPDHLEKEYFRLMSLKEKYLKGLSDAERHKLIGLYDHLTYVWTQNLTAQLHKRLEKNQSELNDLLEQKENILIDVKLKYQQKNTDDIQNLENSLKKSSVELGAYLKKLRTITHKKQEKLTTKQLQLQEISLTNETLKKEHQRCLLPLQHITEQLMTNLKEKQEELKILSVQRENESKKLQQNSTPYNLDLKLKSRHTKPI